MMRSHSCSCSHNSKRFHSPQPLRAEVPRLWQFAEPKPSPHATFLPAAYRGATASGIPSRVPRPSRLLRSASAQEEAAAATGLGPRLGWAAPAAPQPRRWLGRHSREDAWTT